MTKKILAVLTSVALALSLTACGAPEESGGMGKPQMGNTDVMPEIPVMDESAFEYKYNSSMGGMVITDYLKESPKVHIPDTLEDEPVVGVNLGECKKELTHLYLPDSVVRMSLSDKTEETLQYIGFPANGTDYNVAVKYDPDYFGKMTAEKYYNEAVKNAYSDFTGYKNLLSIGISEKCPRYKSYDGMLYYDYGGKKILLVCPQGKSGNITVPKGTTAIGSRTFYNCKDIASISIPDSVTEIGNHAFEGCTSLSRVNIPDSVTELKNDIFDGCTSLTNVTYKGKTYNFTNIGELFDSIMYPTMSGGMVIENNTLVKVSENAVMIEVPDTVTEIAEDAFNNTNKLTEIRFKNKTYTHNNIKNLYAAVRGEEGLTIVNGVLKKVSPELTKVVIPNRVTAIDREAFDNCTRLTSVTIPNSLTAIDLYAFSSCSSLTSVTIPNSVTSINGWAFCDCTSLTSVTIPDSVTQIGQNAFYGCTSLTNVTIPNSVTAIGYYTFYGCTSLKSITIPNSVTTISWGAFSGCTNLTNVTIPDSVTYIGNDYILNRAFDGCKNIKATYKGKTYDYAHIDDLYKAINGN